MAIERDSFKFHVITHKFSWTIQKKEIPSVPVKNSYLRDIRVSE